MQARQIVILLSASALFLCCTVYGQTLSSGTAAPGPGSVMPIPAILMGIGVEFPISTVAGAPFSAEETNDRTQTLGDGTHIVQNSKPLRMFRDSEGRTRMERSMFSPLFHPGTDGPVLIEIRDPVVGVLYRLDVQKRIAYRIPMPRGSLAPGFPHPEVIGEGANASTNSQTGSAGIRVTPSSPGRPTPFSRVASGGPRPEHSSEPLGTQEIEGVLAEGTRTTMTIPVDFEGNDRPIVRSCERWMSQELKLLVLSQCSDPRLGDTTTRVYNIASAEPDPTLFQVPVGYKIVKEKSRFPTVSVTQP